jgi:uncharacterized membrane protein (UPF0127 family)
MCALRSIRPLRLVLASRRDDRTCGSLRQALAAALLVLALALGSALAFEPGSLTIETRDGQAHRFTIELAASPADRSKGLMFRESMAADHGMLFDFHAEAPVSMWMRNTVLPLDMLFIGQDGRIRKIAADTVPFSEAIISSPGPVRAVLELNAGTARRLGLAEGDRVRHPIFERPS